MTAKTFSDAMSELDNKYIAEALFYDAKANRLRRVRRWPIALIAAILALLLMGAGVAAAIHGDSIQSWLSHYWEVITGQSMTEEQTALLDHLSQDIAISQTSGDVTVTVDSATIGDDTFFLLLRVEGPQFSNRKSYDFEDVAMEVTPNPTETGGLSGYGLEYQALDGDGALLLLLSYNYASDAGYEKDTSPLDVVLSLENLATGLHTDREKQVAEGQWKFQFSLDRSNLPEPIELPDTEITLTDNGWEGERLSATFTGIELTCTGLRFCYDLTDGALNLGFQLSVVLDSGVTIETSGGVGAVLEDGKTMSESYQWFVPVNLDEVSALVIGETTIPVP